MKVLIVTNLYPNAREPGRGIFNKQQFDELAKLCDVKIIAPVAWRPGREKTADCRLKTADREVGDQRSEVTGSILVSSLWSMVCGLWSAVCGDARHSCTAAMHRAPHPVIFHPRWLAIPVIGRRWHGRFYYWGIRRLFRRLCREWQPDVVLATWAYPDAWAVSRLVGGIGSQSQLYTGEGNGGPPLPFVVKVHGSDINAVADVEWRLRKLQETLERADGVVCVSRGLKEEIDNFQVSGFRSQVSQFGNRQIVVIPNGVDAELFHPLDKGECRKELGWDPDKKHILFVGNLVPVKGLKYLIKALDDLPDDVVLHVVGGGKGQTIDHRPKTIDLEKRGELSVQTQPTTQQPNNLSSRLQSPPASLREALWAGCRTDRTTDAPQRILFHGRVEHRQIPVWMNAADVFCLPSLQEGCPNVILEALACGTPVVASNVGGIPELIDSEEKGLLVGPKDVEGLMEGLSAVLRQDGAVGTRRPTENSRTWADSARDLYEVLKRSSL